MVSGFSFIENDEPIHIHVKKGSAEGKIWLEPHCLIAFLHGIY